MAFRAPLATASKDNLRLFSVAAAVIVVVFAISIFSLEHIRETTLRYADQYLSSYSNVVAQQAESAIHSTDIVLSSVADYLARNGINDADALSNLRDADTVHRLLKDRLTGMPQMASFMVVDNSGKVVATSYDSSAKDVNLSDRDYFRALRDDPGLETVLTEPLKSRISGTRVFLLVRRLSDPDGAFMGLVVGALSQRYFEDYYTATVSGDYTAVELKRGDGAVLAAYPSTVGQPAPASLSEIAMRLRGAEEAAPPASTGRLEASRRIANFPLSVLVAQTLDDVLREWRKIALLTGLMSACIAVLVAAFSVIVARNWRARALALERVHFLAHHDSLTQLCNRAQLIASMNEALDYVRRGTGGAFCIHMLDLDMFKAVNDTLGHGAGDKLLQQVGVRLREVTRSRDVVARLGGDEFAVIQQVEERIARRSAEALAQRLLSRIAEPYAIDGHNVVIGTSIGAAHAPDDGLEVDELMAKADLALYKAKASGRNALCFYDSSLESEARQRHNLQLDLHAALAGERFELRYQPIVAATTGDIVCAEALVRWRHPRDGLIGPDCFIPVAEASGVIVALGEWVLRRACLDALSWPDSIRIAVNISPIQLKKGDLGATVKRILAETGLLASRLELEITEGVLIQNGEENLEVITQLRKLGVTISLDDFGTGYSSLAYIRSFPLDKIKIDKSFVVEAARRQDCAAIVSAIVYLARSLNIATVAEGVETEEQHQFVRAAGCTFFQGYYFGRPDAAAPFLKRLVRSAAPCLQSGRAV